MKYYFLQYKDMRSIPNGGVLISLYKKIFSLKWEISRVVVEEPDFYILKYAEANMVKLYEFENNHAALLWFMLEYGG